MSLLTAVLGRSGPPSRRSLESPSVPLSSTTGWDEEDGWLTGGTGGRPASGVRVNARTAMGFGPWFRGVNLLARGVAKVPCHVYRRTGSGKERDISHPAYTLIRRKANRYQTALQFKLLLAGHAITRGNGYAYIDRDGMSRPVARYPLDPATTYPVRANGRLFYVTQVGDDDVRLSADDVIHYKGLGYDGLTGYSVVQMAKETLGLGIAARQYGSIFFRNSGRPALVIQHPGNLSQAAVERLKAKWHQMYEGLDNAHKTAVLEEGMTANPLGFSAEDSQLIETWKFSPREVANFLNLPPHKLGDESRTSFASLEMEDQAYLDDSLDPWLCIFEDEDGDKLLTEEEKRKDSHFIEFHRDSLVRADITARTNSYRTATGGRPWMTQNEVRTRENLNPLDSPTADLILEPLNMAAQGDVPSVQGGQVKDLIAIAEAVLGGVPPEAAELMIKQSWPGFPADDLAKFINSLKTAEPPEPVAVPALPPAPAPKQLPAPRSDELAPALRALAGQERRMIRRLGRCARRAAKKPREFLDFLNHLADDHRAVVTEALAPHVAALAALENRTADPAAAAEELIAAVRESLLDASGEATASELPAKVDECLTRLERGDEPAPPAPMALTVNVQGQPVTVPVEVRTPEQTINVAAPVVNVAPPDVTVNTPETRVDVHVPETNIHVAAPEVRVDAPQIDVHVPEQGAPVVHVGSPNVENKIEVRGPDQPAPVVNVTVPAPKVENNVNVNVPPPRLTRKEVERDAHGDISAVVDREVEDE